MAAMKSATANGNTYVEEGTGCPDEVLYQTPDGTGGDCPRLPEVEWLHGLSLR